MSANRDLARPAADPPERGVPNRQQEITRVPIRPTDDEHWYHGTTAELKPGDQLVPGMPKAHSGSTGEHVYFGDRDIAIKAAAGAMNHVGGRGHVYRVEPTGPYESDPGSPQPWQVARRTRYPLRVTADMELPEYANRMAGRSSQAGSYMYGVEPDQLREPADYGWKQLALPTDARRDREAG